MDQKDNNDYKKKCCATDIGRGCCFSGSGEDITAEMREGCFKLHEYDWLQDMPDMFAEDIIEVRFKNTRRGYYKNVNNLQLKIGDIVAVEASPGHDIGIVSLTGDMVLKQMRRVGFNPLNGEYKKVYRKAKPGDIEKWQEAIAMEQGIMIRSRQIAADIGLNMKIGDVEMQGDKIKGIFYYIADERVDFRELIKIFADRFKIRIEMKQIGARQEAGRIGGLGACGRELCCASWMSNFVSITTNSARHQEISLNPQKLAGQCGKLKCCLVYELDTYLDARKEFPRINQPLQVLDGDYYLVKTDILARTMWFSTDQHSLAGMQPLHIDRVKEIIRMNQAGKKPDRLITEEMNKKEVEPSFVNAIGEESITRFDRSKDEKRRGGRNRGRGRDGRGGDNRDNRGDAPSGEQRTGGDRNTQGQQNNRGGQRSGGSQGGDRSNNRGGNPQQGQHNGNSQNRQGGNGERGGGGDRGGRNRGRGRDNRGGNKPQGDKPSGNE